MNRVTRGPANPSIAGSKVIAMSIATATTPAAARPITDMNGMPTRVSPHSATMTVSAANTTELPEVPTARATDSSTSIPRITLARCRDAMNRA